MKDSNISMVEKEVEVLFNKVPESQPLLRQTKYSNYERQTFADDSWIFAGTENSADVIMEDTFGNMNVKLSDKKYSQQICARLAKSYPLHFGDIGGDSLGKKFSSTQSNVVRTDHKGNKRTTTQTSGQLTRQIFEDCTFSHGIKIPQQTQPGAVSIQSQYRIENISKYANVTLKQADVLSRIYCELGLSFKTTIKVNKAIRRRKTHNPWDIKINSDGLTLLGCAQELKKLRTEDQEAPDWMHYDDGIFEFKMLDDLAAFDINELDISEEVDPLASKPGEYTYWNISTIPISAAAKGKKTYKGFLKAMAAVWNKTVKKENIPALHRYAKKFTASQRKELNDAIKQVYVAC